MTIETAQFVVQRAGDQFKCTGADLIDKLQAGDIMAVTRPGDDTYKWVRPVNYLTYEFTVNVTDLEFYISTQPKAEYNNYESIVDWGDGIVETIDSPYNKTHRYLANGIYDIKISVKEGTPYSLYGGSTNAQYKWVSIDNVDANWNWGSSLRYGWQSCRELTSFPFINTSMVEDFSQTWKSCSKLTSFPVLDFSSAENMLEAWSGCTQLSSFPQFAFPKATSLESAWENCTSLTSFPLIDISTGTDLSLNSAWKGCSGLTSFPDLDYSKVERIFYSWRDCTELVTWNSNATVTLPEVVSLGGAWWGCSNLTSIPLLVIPKATSLYYCWYSCSSLKTIPLMDTSQITNWAGAFGGSGIEIMPAFDFSKATNFAQTFSYMSSLKTFDGPIESGNVTDFSKLFYRCIQLTPLPYIDTSNGTNFKEMFHFCRSITSIPSTLDFSKGTNFNEVVADCDVLTDFPPNMFDVTGTLVTNAFARGFSGCSLTPTSIENILVSLDTNGQSNITLSIDGPNNAKRPTWTAAADTAYDNLIAKGWTIIL